TADRNRSHWSTSKTPSYTKSVSWQHHPFNGSLRDECLNIHWFLSLEDAQDKLDLHPQKFFCGPRANGT
ncbi:hypothetical protein, partial [Klebsiella pneumoniae]